MFCSVYISNMASESPQIEVRENEVLLFKNSQPVLRVERGTTLRIIKLLYQADLRNKGTVIGVRPQTNDVLPCVLTLDHSPLELARYEIIALESTPETPFQATRAAIAAKSLCQESFSNTSSHSLPIDGVGVGEGSSRQQQQDDILHESVMQRRQSINHTMPLSVSVSPETSRSVSHAATGSSSSLLLTKKDIFSSCSSGFPSSRRKKTARKSVFPRRISPLSSPIHSLDKHNHETDETFFQRKVTARSTSPMLAGRLVGLDEVTGGSAGVKETLDSPGLCDSTENENLMNGPAKTGEEEPEREQTETHNASHLLSYSVEDSAEFSNFHSIESSSTNGSSPSISEGQPMVMDIIDSRETSGGENDSDSNHVSSEHSPHQQRLCISGMDASSGVRYKEDPPINQGKYDCPRTPTAVVVLENTIQVKMEPKEMSDSPGNMLPDQNSKDINFPFSINSNGENNDALNSENHFQTKRSNARLISSKDSNSSSLAMQQTSTLLPQVVSVVGAAPEGKTAENSYHHHHHHHHHHDHRAQHTGNRHNCDICQKQFDSPNSVLRHKRSHTGERPYICNICGWGFNLSGNLNQHLAIHQKVKPFKCVYCGKTFARSNVLKAHVRCHTGERPFQCQLCGSKFIIGHNLKKHMLTRHGIKEDDKMYSQNNVPGSDGNSQPSEDGDHDNVNTTLPISQ